MLQNGQPVAYASRSLTDTERNYAEIKKELRAIMFGAEKFTQYTYGRKVFVESDHKRLEVIYQKPLMAAPKHMYLADMLSRSPLSRNEKVLSIEKEIEEIWTVDFSSTSLEDIR